MRQNYYPVPDKAYLFGDVLKRSRAQIREEPVRQWCAFELIRAYGIPISNLEFERRVKVGSKTYEIDITVLREGRPWIVVECKERRFTRHEEACGQAQSYADAASILAPYLLYTNGTRWLVKRKVRDAWLALDDLPRWAQCEPTRDLGEILESIYELKPLLYKLDEPVTGLDATGFLDHLQRFFIHSNPLLRSVDDRAIHASDHILRALGDKTHHVKYRVGKLSYALSCWERFRADREIGMKMEMPDFDGRMRPFLSALHYDLERLVPHLDRPFTIDALALRLNVALMTYGEENENGKKEHVQIIPAVHQALRELIDALLAERFDSQLPDIVHRDANSRVKDDCKGAWLELRKQYRK